MKKGDIIVLEEDIIIYGTGVTWFYYKGNKYRVVDNLRWNEPGWQIKLMREKENKLYGSEYGYFSEDYLFKKFDCVKWQRKEKIKKISNLK